ncbi:ATP-binding cassette domain-containing protein (plasmid) [Rhizobium sp. RCAM05350]|nr:ATP-binding cassette domain-containing protein [Rhizobium sp. RCAM05350]
MSPHKNVDAFESYFHTFPRLAERRDQPAGTLSGGEKKLLSLVRGLSENKPVIVIDEPTEGVQYENVMKMANLVNTRKAEGTAFIIVEQNLTLVDEIADELLVLDQGKIALAGSASAISRADIQAHMIV